MDEVTDFIQIAHEGKLRGFIIKSTEESFQPKNTGSQQQRKNTELNVGARSPGHAVH